MYQKMLPAIAQAEQQQLKFNQTLEMVQGPVNAFVNGLTQGLQGIIDGTMSAEEAFAKMLRGIADALVQQAARMIAEYIAIGIARSFAGIPAGKAAAPTGVGAVSFGGGFPGRAAGSPVMADRPYMVGENGPELFVPQNSGRIMNNTEAMERYGPSNERAALPQQPIQVEYTTTSIAGTEYVTAEQFQQGMAAAAEQGAKAGELEDDIAA